MKRFFKKLMAVIFSVVAILSICAFSVAACETEDVESVLVDTTDSETEDVDFVLVDTMGSETDISPQSVQYGHLKGTHTEDGCSITFEVKVALRDDPDYVSGFTIVGVEKASITMVEMTGWKSLDECTLDSYTIGRTGQTATLHVSFKAAKSNGISLPYPDRRVTISLSRPT